MPGRQDIGNGIGYLYCTAVDGTTIIAAAPNIASGVRQMRQLGASVAPIATERPAIGEIRVTSAGTGGDVSDITIGGVNQIGANVPTTVGDTEALASDLANAINSFTPGSGPNFTANAYSGRVLIFSPPASGVTVNGSTITVSVTDVSITTTTTDFSGGADGSGSYDSVLGRRFFIDADYGAPATPTSIALAIEITDYMVVRGNNAGVPIISATVATDKITSLVRYSEIQEIAVGTQGGAASDELVYINPSNFSLGDMIRLRTVDAAQVTTVLDASDTSNPVPFKNIYLCNAAPFDLEARKSITLTLMYDSTLGFLWAEDTRAFSSASGIITVTKTQLLTVLNGATTTAGQLYFVTANSTNDQGGLVVEANSSSTIKLDVDYIAYVPDWQNTGGTVNGPWTPFIATPAVGQRYIYNQMMYDNLTGAVGTAPDSDAINWQVVPYSSGEYITEIHKADWDPVTNFISRRRDKRGNEVFQDPDNYYVFIGVTPENCLPWGNDAARNNTMDNAAFQIQNFNGATCIDNVFRQSSKVDTYYCDTTGVLIGNCFERVVFTGVYSDNITNARMNNTTLAGVGSSTEFGSIIQHVQIDNSSISGDSTTAQTIEGNLIQSSTIVLAGDVAISACTFNGAADVTLGSIADRLSVTGCVFTGTSATLPLGITNTSGNSVISYCTFLPSCYVQLGVQATNIREFVFDRKFINTTPIISQSFAGSIFVELDMASVFAGGTLTLPTAYDGTGGTFRLVSANATETVDEIINLGTSAIAGIPNLATEKQVIYRFIAEDGLQVTFDNTAIAAMTAGQICSDAATDVITGRGTSYTTDDKSDYIEYTGFDFGVGVPVVRKLFLNTVI